MIQFCHSFCFSYVNTLLTTVLATLAALLMALLTAPVAACANAPAPLKICAAKSGTIVIPSRKNSVRPTQIPPWAIQFAVEVSPARVF
jgi:hypothetical protein